MKKSLPDIVISIVLLGFLTSMAVQIPAIPDVSKGYPMVLIIIAYIMTIIMLLSNVVKIRTQEKEKTEVLGQVKIIVPYCLMIVVYLFLMNKIGYIASTAIFMIASLFYLKLKNKVVMIILSVVLTVILYYVFTNFLAVILPRGDWFNIAF